MKRILAILLCCVMVFSLSAASALELSWDDYDYWFDVMAYLVDEIGMRKVGRPGEYAAYEYLVDNCLVSGVSSENTAYSALVQKSANSEGIAFAYVELCRQLGVDCRIVYGQLDWHEHCWNIIKLDGSYYHVDVSAAGAKGIEASFLKNDEGFWGLYRWDVASYPKCAGELEYSDLILS